jgi:hypothetical protein
VGTWSIKGDIITVNLTRAGADAGGGEINLILEYQLIIIDLDNITLIDSSRVVNLIRTEDDLMHERMYYNPN